MEDGEEEESDQKNRKMAAQEIAHSAISITVVTRGEGLMQGHNAKVQEIMERLLHERQIKLQCNTSVNGIQMESNGMISLQLEPMDDSERQTLSPSSDISSSLCFHECLWCTSAQASSWLSSSTPFPTSHQGFLKVEDT